MYIYIFIYVYIYICIYLYMYIFIYVYIYIHIHVVYSYINIHIYIYTHINEHQSYIIKMPNYAITFFLLVRFLFRWLSMANVFSSTRIDSTGSPYFRHDPSKTKVFVRSTWEWFAWLDIYLASVAVFCFSSPGNVISGGKHMFRGLDQASWPKAEHNKNKYQREAMHFGDFREISSPSNSSMVVSVRGFQLLSLAGRLHVGRPEISTGAFCWSEW